VKIRTISIESIKNFFINLSPVVLPYRVYQYKPYQYIDIESPIINH